MVGRIHMRRWPIIALVVAVGACAPDDEELDLDTDMVPPATETAPEPTTTGMMSEAEVVQAVSAVNQAEIDEAELARSNSQNQQVTQFAEMMITDHTRLQEEIQQASGLDATGAATTQPQTPDGTTPDATPGTTPQSDAAGQAGAGVIQQLRQEAETARSRLEGLSGEEFDQAYMTRQVEAHQSALDLLDNQLLQSAQNSQLRQVLEGARPVIEQHLRQAQQIQQQLGTGGTGTDAGTGGPDGTV